MKQSSNPAPRHCKRSVAIQPLLPVIASEAWQSSNPSSRHCERSEAIQPLPSRHCERSVAIHRPHTRHCERSEAIQSPEHQIWGSVLPFRPPRASNLGGRFTLPTTPSIKFGGPFYPSDHPGHQIWGVVLPFRPPRASNLGVRFTLPTTPSIEFGGRFHLPDSSEVKFGGHSCTTDLSDTLIWGSFLHHRPARHPNLGVKLPVPRKLHTPLLPKPTSQSESPHLFFATQEATTGSPRGNEVEVGRSWHEVSEGLCGDQERNAEHSGDFAPLPRFLFTFKLHFLL